MKSLANAFRLVATEGAEWSVKKLASEFSVSAPISVSLLIDRILNSSSFSEIRRFFVIVMENRSFDHMLGFSQLTGVDAVTGEPTSIRGLSGIKTVGDGVVAAEFNVDSEGRRHTASAPADFAIPADPGHEFADVAEQVRTDPVSGVNGGFVKNFEKHMASDSNPIDVGTVMTGMAPNQVPVLATLAREFAVCDMWFSSVPGATWPNRFFVHAASSGGRVDNPSGASKFAHIYGKGYQFANGTIFGRLNDKDIPWTIYADSVYPVSWAVENVHFNDIWSVDLFVEEIAKPDFPYRYVFFEPNQDGVYFTETNDQHPPGDIRPGEEFIAKIYNALSSSPYWSESALIIFYDEHGGLFDHVRPPSATPPGDTKPSENEGDGFDFSRLGCRVPAVIVSPRIPKGTIDHTVYDHTSLLRTLEGRFGLSPLTRRDAAANDFSHLFRLRHRTTWPKSLKAASRPRERKEIRWAETDPSTPIEDVHSDLRMYLEVALIRESKLLQGAQLANFVNAATQIKTFGDATALLPAAPVRQAVPSTVERDQKTGS